MANLVQENVTGFRDFLVGQNVVGIATGLAVGGAASALATSFINNIIMTPLGYLFGSSDGLKGLSAVLGVKNGEQVIWHYGEFLSSALDFVVIALVFYLVVKMLKLDQVKKKA